VLERALTAVEGGPSRTVGLRGEPGIGKSRLLAELASRAEERGHLVLAGRATELERDLPFALLIDAFDRHLASEPPRRLDDEHLAQLAAVLPAVGQMPGVEPAPSPDGRHRVARAVRGLLELLARQRPVTVLLDDVHWADAASADVLALLIHRPPPTRVLLGLAARAGRAPDLEAALETAVRNDSADVVDVGPLSREAADALLPSLQRAARERVYVESGGNPFYLDALARAAAADPYRRAATGMAGVPRAVRAALAGEVGVLPAIRLNPNLPGRPSGCQRRWSSPRLTSSSGRTSFAPPTSHAAFGFATRWCGAPSTRERPVAHGWPPTPVQPRRLRHVAPRRLSVHTMSSERRAQATCTP
jgi:AAA ATPase domain